MSTITKKALAGSMKSLMNTTPLGSISVSDITGECGLNRKSFYYHFQDKYDLVNWIFRSELQDYLACRPCGDFWSLLEQILEYLDANRRFYKNALGAPEDNRMRETLAEVLGKYLQLYLNIHLENGCYFTNVQREAAQVSFLADAFVTSIVKWLNKTPPITPAQYVDLLRRPARMTV